MGTEKTYQIILRGYLEPQWSEWFDGLEIDYLNSGETSLTGPLIDQAALYRVLLKIRDLGIPLISVNQKHVE